MTLPSVLQQSDVWVDGDGRELLLDAMDRHHRANLIPFLRGNAVTLYLTHVGRGGEYPEHDGRPGPVIAEEWLEHTPLMRRLVELESGRPIEERRETFERNGRYEKATGYRKVRLG
jgi:hypothetical protein